MNVSSRSQTIVAPRNEIDKSAITQKLKLLANLRLHVLVTGIEVAQMSLECIDFVESEFALPKRLHAFHDIEQPTSRLKRFASEKERFLPFLENRFLRANNAVLHNVNLADLWHLAEQDI